MIEMILISWALASSFVLGAPQRYCKPIVGSPDWPTLSQWDALNSSVGGRLIAPVPPGQVCQMDNPGYSASACASVLQDWTSSSWHAQDPFTADYNDEACLPDARAPCSAAAYPAYVVNASTVEDVQAAMRFAHGTGVRLIVKGTGHDLPGRSSGRNSLSIYTHNLRGIGVTMGDARAKAYGGVAAVKIAAGTRVGEVYAKAAAHNITVVLGADADVGIGGWITGGGHSPISSLFGLGADQVLEMEVVTANGTHLIINEHSYPGLFWAMRGGGGSTFAVLISVTVISHPNLDTATYIFSYNTTSNSDTFWSLAATFHNQLPALNDQGVMGYYYMFPDNGGANAATRGSVVGIWLVPQKSETEAKRLIGALEEAISNKSRSWQDAVSMSNVTNHYTSFSSAWALNQPESVGNNVRLASRLLPRSALETNTERLAQALKATALIPQYPILGNLVAGQGVKNVKIPGGGNAVNPAWRDAYSHLILVRSWPFLNDSAKVAVTTQLREVDMVPLRKLAPNSGAYVNEADPTEPDWQQTFWGSNYPRLLKLKNRWDPDGVFWCKPCVGHEEWTVQSDFGIEGAVGQTPGRICKS